jgi:hypothetical protein
VTVLGLSLKPTLVASQLGGYIMAKFIGIKVIAEMPAERRARGIVLLIVAAEGALGLFGILPQPWKAVCLFLNGLALGMVYGLVLGFLEGRQLTEAFVAGLCASFILADGVTKSVGAWLLSRGVSEYWMPGAAGLFFLAPVLLCTWMLSRIPPPSEQDILARAGRAPLKRADRRWLLSRHAAGLALLATVFTAVTVLRTLRADFAREVWDGLGHPAEPSMFTRSEVYVALGVLVVNGCAVAIHDNRRAFFTALGTCALGFVLIAVALVSRPTGALGGFGFMVTVGLGLYLPYVAIHTTIFERLLAMTRDRGNVGFLMYVADSSGYMGYLGYVVAMAFWGSRATATELLHFFTVACAMACVVSLICLALCWGYFATHCPDSALARAAEIPG